MVPLKDLGGNLRSVYKMILSEGLAPGITAVATYNGWFVIRGKPDLRQDALCDFPVLAGPFPGLIQAREWWGERAG